MSRIFLSHSSKDTREAIALKAWLTEQRPELGDEIFIDVDTQTGLKLGEQWKTQLFTGKSRCEYFICLLSQNWANLRMWDATTGKPVGQPIAGHTQAVNSVSFSPDRHRVVSSSDDGLLRLWPAPPKEEWVTLLCDKLSANMTHAEWNKWVSPNIEYVKVCASLPDPPSA